MKKSKIIIFKIIILFIFIIILIFLLFAIKNEKTYSYLNILKCKSKGGEVNDWGSNLCIIKDLEDIKKNLDNKKTYLTFNGNNQNEGNILHIDNIKGFYGNSLFVVPLDIKRKNNTESYLVLFKNGYPFSIIDYYKIGDNIQIKETKIPKTFKEKSLFYSYEVIQDYAEDDELKSIALRISPVSLKLYLKESCEKNNYVEEKTKGNGEKYKVCVFENGNQCELESSIQGDCPPEGAIIKNLITEEEIYCQITGGMLNKQLNECAFYGYICDLDEYYNGECKK